MEMPFLLIAVVVLGVPVIAILALVRTGKLRELLEQSQSELRREIEVLRGNVERLQREVRELSGRELFGRELGSAGAPRAGAAARPVAAAEPQPQAVSTSPRPANGPMAPLPSPVRPAQGVPAPIPAMSGQPAKAGEPTPAGATNRPQYVQSVPQPPSAVPPPPAPAPPRTARPVAAFSAPPAPPPPPRKSLREWLGTTLPLEEMLGLNVFAKIGIVLLVLGLALLGRVALLAMGPVARVGLIYAAGAALLGGGIWLERKERYRLIGRAGIGGGWALLFFTTYALSHVAPMAILQSNTADCILMLIVAIGMVAHTLRYRSQVVTGLAFLLAFSTVAMSQDTVYSLVSGVILALGIVAITLRMGWFELEIFGILASFANHFYWLHKLYPEGVSGHPFRQFWPSCIILVLYWTIFRISYVARRTRNPRDEMFSTIAALLNPVFLLAIMKFQATRPELAFYALLGLGVLEFLFGQLNVTRRRPAFILLSVLGTILVFAAVPFKFSGNNIALLWMIAAEVLLVAGIVQKEVVFRRLGLIGGLSTGLLVIYKASSIITFRLTSQAPLTEDGVLLLACSAAFYINVYLLRLRWKALFTGMDDKFAVGESYLGAVSAFLGSWALFGGDKTAVAWAVLMLALAYGKRWLDDNHLLIQMMGFAVAALVAVFTVNVHAALLSPHHVAGRLTTLPVLACAFYLVYWILGEGEDGRVFARRLALWSGSAMLATLAWTDVKATWLALVWLAFAALLSLAGRRLAIADLTFQEHVLAVMAAAQLVASNIDAPGTFERYGPLVGCAAIYYAISRCCTIRNAAYARPAAWAHTCAGTAFLASLAWREAPQPWLAVVWILFALALALTDRIFGGEELPWQAHILAALAVIRAVTLNFSLLDKWHGIDMRLITISTLALVLYALARWIRLPALFATGEVRHSYTWVASILLAWMLWCELQPVGVAVGLAILGLVLFEIGHWGNIRQLRVQGYGVLIAAFVRIFFVNLTAAKLPGEAIGPRIFTVVPIAVIFFLVWAQLQSRRDRAETQGVSLTDLMAYLGTCSIAGLLYVEVRPERVILAWAVLVASLLTSSLLLHEEVFLHQGQLLTVGIAVRGLAHNIFGGSYVTNTGWRGSIAVLSLTSAVLLLSLLIAFRLRARYAELDQAGSLIRSLVRRPEQILFFTPVLLMSFAIAVKLDPGMVTLSWGIEGVMVIVLGLMATQRSYRLTGLLLLLLCVGKIVALDAWHLAERDRYITFIALGAALTLVSTLYGKYRETVRKLL